MKMIALLFVASGASVVAGCLDGEEKAMREAITSHLSDEIFCMFSGLHMLGDKYWVDLRVERSGKARALEAEKLIEIGPKEKPGMVYEEWAWANIQDPIKALFSGERICFGSLEFVQIKEFTKPAADAMGQIVTDVTFSCKLNGAPAWALRSPIREAFRELDSALSKGLEGQIKLVQTNKGWKTFPAHMKGWACVRMELERPGRRSKG
jgi:hypothetical protein